jgi:hypothetical protein
MADQSRRKSLTLQNVADQARVSPVAVSSAIRACTPTRLETSH